MMSVSAEQVREEDAWDLEWEEQPEEAWRQFGQVPPVPRPESARILRRTRKKSSRASREAVVLGLAFAAYQAGLAEERVEEDLFTRFGGSDFCARASLIDSAKGFPSSDAPTTSVRGKKRFWATKSAQALLKGLWSPAAFLLLLPVAAAP